MIIKVALMLWVAAFVVALFATGKSRSWLARLALGGFCLLLLAALIRLLRI